MALDSFRTPHSALRNRRREVMAVADTDKREAVRLTSLASCAG
jgi:hypothetical protein